MAKHPLVYCFMKEVNNLKPTIPKYNFTWDVGIVLNYLGTYDSVFDLSGKLATLLAVLCCKKARELLAVIDLKNISFEEDLLFIRVHVFCLLA